MDEPLPVPTIEKDAHRDASFPARTLSTERISASPNSACSPHIEVSVALLSLNLRYYLHKLNNYTFEQIAQLAHLLCAYVHNARTAVRIRRIVR